MIKLVEENCSERFLTYSLEDGMNCYFVDKCDGSDEYAVIVTGGKNAPKKVIVPLLEVEMTATKRYNTITSNDVLAKIIDMVNKVVAASGNDHGDVIVTVGKTPMYVSSGSDGDDEKFTVLVKVGVCCFSK